MIPKRAFFTWVGDGPLPWLRQLSVDSFSANNPEWDVDLIRVEPIDGLSPAQITDIERYRELSERGGVYLDTDIVFFRPFPTELLEADIAVTIDRSAYGAIKVPDSYPGFTNLAVLGSAPFSRFFRFMYDSALRRLEWCEEDSIDLATDNYQVFGVALLDRVFMTKNQADIERQFESTISNVPLDLVLPIRWNETHKLFNGTEFDPPDGTIGAHWYGGCPEAKLYQQQITLDTYKYRPCYLSSAIDEAFK